MEIKEETFESLSDWVELEEDKEYNRYVSASNVINEVRLCAAAYPEKRSEGKELDSLIGD